MENKSEEYEKKIDPNFNPGDSLDSIITGNIISFIQEIEQINNISISMIPLDNIKKYIKAIILDQLENAFKIQDNIAHIDAESKQKRRYHNNPIPDLAIDNSKSNSCLMEFFDDTITPI